MFSGGGQTSLSSLSDIGSSNTTFRIIRDFAGVTSRSTRRAGFANANTAPYRKFGFTLAEVLITLGIIGVVAAMTMPALINNTKNKELEASLKKNYSLMQQVLLMMSTDNGETIAPKVLTRAEFKEQFENKLQKLKACGYGSSETNACVPHMGKDYIFEAYKTYSGKTAQGYYFDDGQILMNDGSFIMIENTGSDNLFLSVDVNGFAKKPNKWGHDVFTFQVMPNGKLLPMGAPNTLYNNMNTYCSLASNDGYNGISCAYQALNEKNYFKNLPK